MIKEFLLSLTLVLLARPFVQASEEIQREQYQYIGTINEIDLYEIHITVEGAQLHQYHGCDCTQLNSENENRLGEFWVILFTGRVPERCCFANAPASISITQMSGALSKIINDNRKLVFATYKSNRIDPTIPLGGLDTPGNRVLYGMFPQKWNVVSKDLAKWNEFWNECTVINARNGFNETPAPQSEWPADIQTAIQKKTASPYTPYLDTICWIRDVHALATKTKEKWFNSGRHNTLSPQDEEKNQKPRSTTIIPPHKLGETPLPFCSFGQG